MKIIKYVDCQNIDIELLDEHHCIKKHQTYQNFKRGTIKNPYHRSVFGVGYVGEGKYKTKENGKFTIFYQQWKNMLLRCYVKADRHRPYEDAEVCDEWLNFQTFSKWYDEHYYELPNNERLHIDKDVRVKDNRVYSPDACMLVPQSINEVFKRNTKKSVDCDLPETIKRVNNGYKVEFRAKNLGVYRTVEECLEKYNTAKKEYIKELIGRYNGLIPEDVTESLLNWQP